jgi:hypothetical protein
VANQRASRPSRHLKRVPTAMDPGTDESEEMTMRNGDKIIHIVPAAGYYAAYQHGGEVTYNPVAAWIVLEDQQGRQGVDGVDPSGRALTLHRPGHQHRRRPARWLRPATCRRVQPPPSTTVSDRPEGRPRRDEGDHQQNPKPATAAACSPVAEHQNQLFGALPCCSSPTPAPS